MSVLHFSGRRYLRNSLICVALGWSSLVVYSECIPQVVGFIGSPALQLFGFLLMVLVALVFCYYCVRLEVLRRRFGDLIQYRLAFSMAVIVSMVSTVCWLLLFLMNAADWFLSR